jgi:hypothetical protein
MPPSFWQIAILQGFLQGTTIWRQIKPGSIEGGRMISGKIQHYLQHDLPMILADEYDAGWHRYC